MQTLCRYQQCASQQRNGHLGHDDKYLIWFIKEVEGFRRPHQTDLRSPPPRTQTYMYLYAQKPHAAFLHIFKAKTTRLFFFFFYPNILKPLFSVKNLAVLSRRGDGGNARGAVRGGGVDFSAPSLAIPPILLLRTVKPVKSCWRGVTKPTAACSDGGISCVRRWLDYIISIILLGFTLGIEALALIWN